MTKKRLPFALTVAVLAVIITLNWASIARATIFYTTGASNALQFVAGMTANAASGLPFKVNADGDGVTGHLVVDCSTGCSGGGGGSAPFTGGASGVATAANQSIGLFAYNGTTMDSLRDDGSKNLLVSLGAAIPVGTNAIGSITNTAFGITGAIPAGSNTIGTFLPPLSAVSGTGTAQAVNQMFVAGCAFNSSLPTITSGNVGPEQCDTTGHQVLAGAGTAGAASGGVLTVQGVASMTPFLITPPLTGLNSTGTAGAVNQAIVADCNFTTAPATVVTTNVVPISCNNKAQVITDAQSIAGAAITTATGVSGQHIYPANTSGGGCAGINLSTGTQITRVNLAPVTITASEATTQIVALAASKFIHICGVTITGVLSTGGAINIITGTGVNCVTGTTTLATYQFGVNTAGFVFDKGTGEQSMIDSATASEICVSSGAFVSTQAVTLNLVYAQY